MKTSNKILWGSLGGLFLVCVIFLLVLRALLGSSPVPVNATARYGAMGSREIDMSGLAAIDMQGNWQVKLIHGPDPSATVEGAQDLLETLFVQRRGDFLALRMPKQRNDKRKLTLSATLPELNRLHVQGVVEIRFEGFSSEHLSIRMQGVSKIVGRKGRINALDLRSEGVSRMDLSDLPVEQADLDCEGVFNIDLSMAGGELSGRVKGTGKVRYGGEVSRETILREGPCNVEYARE
jgi:hypothetical protein